MAAHSNVRKARFLLSSLIVLSCLMRTALTEEITISWFIPSDSSLPPVTAQVGDSVKFVWSSFHNVYLHPTGNCDRDGRVEVGMSSGATYTFTADDAGDVVFACDVGSHCNNGQIVTVTVAAPTTKSPVPSSSPSSEPSLSPSSKPSLAPSSSPSLKPSAKPSSKPSLKPSLKPSTKPSLKPSTKPSSIPSMSPSKSPTPTKAPIPGQSEFPSSLPSSPPSSVPSGFPSSLPSSVPSAFPSSTPSVVPSATPSFEPSDHVSSVPSASPSSTTSVAPTVASSSVPSVSPSEGFVGEEVVLTWVIPNDGGPLPEQMVRVGDRAKFEWTFGHNVYVHPTGDCDQTDRVLVGLEGGATYVFEEKDADAGEVVFACDEPMHCDFGQIVTFKVLPKDAGDVTPAPTPLCRRGRFGSLLGDLLDKLT